MGRGLSDQQRRILALAVAVNAMRRDGLPAAEPLVMRALPGRVDVEGDVLAVPLGFAPRLPDLTEQYVLAALYGFKVRESDFCAGRMYEHWWPSTVKRAKRLSVRRALASLVDRGLVVHAWPPQWFHGLGFDKAECQRWADVIERTDKGGNGVDDFWFGHCGFNSCSYARAYWLEPAAFEVVGDLWRDVADTVSELQWQLAAMVREDRGGLPQFFRKQAAEPVVVDADSVAAAASA